MQHSHALAKIAERRLDVFIAHELAHTARAFAAVGQREVQLFNALAEMAALRRHEFNAQNLAKTA